MWHIRILLAVAAFGLLIPAPVEARSKSPRELQRYHFKKGELLYRTGEFSKALEHYKKALEAKRHPSITFNIGQCYRQLGNWKKALFFYELFLSEAPNAGNRAEVNKWIREMKREIKKANAAASAVGRVSVVTTPAGATIRVNAFSGPVAGTTPAVLKLKAGTHLLVLQKAGHKTVQRSVTVGVGKFAVLELTLTATGVTPPPDRRVVTPPPDRRRVVTPPPDRRRVVTPTPTPTPSPAPTSAPFYKAWWFWTGAAVTVAAFGAAGFTGTETASKHEDWEAYHLEKDQKDGKTLAATTDALIAVGAAAAIATTVGVILHVMKRKKERSAARILPSCGPTGCGVWVTGRF